MRRTAIVLVMLLMAAACGDDGGEAVDVALEPIAAIDPCELLDEDTASELAGAEVQRVDDDEIGEGEAGCRYDFADEGIGSGLAAAMRLEQGGEDDVPGGALAQAISLGDAGAVEASETDVKVVYVVREVVVRIEVVPASGEVDDDLIERVVEFAETTEAPVVEAVTGEAPPETTATTAEERSSTTSSTEPEGTTTTAAVDASVEELWGRTAVDLRGRTGEQFEFDCPPGGSIRTIWGDNRTGYTDDSPVCTAGVHAGAITVEEGGTVRIQIVEGQDEYFGSESNGVTSDDWPAWPGGYLVLGTD